MYVLDIPPYLISRALKKIFGCFALFEQMNLIILHMTKQGIGNVITLPHLYFQHLGREIISRRNVKGCN